MKRVFLLIIFVLLLCSCGTAQMQKTKKVSYCEHGTPVFSEGENKEVSKCEIVQHAEPVSITCEDEAFKYNEETKKCENTISIPANRRLGCKDEEKYELKNGACRPKSGKGATKYKINIYSCPENGTLNGKNCEFVDETNPVLTCPEGYEVNEEESTCDKVTYEEPYFRDEPIEG